MLCFFVLERRIEVAQQNTSAFHFVNLVLAA